MQLRLRKAIFTLIFSIATFWGYGQSFLSEYSTLTTQNLEEFFIAWKSYSDSIASKATKYDNLIDSIQGLEYAPKMPQRESVTILCASTIHQNYWNLLCQQPDSSYEKNQLEYRRCDMVYKSKR